MPINRILNRAIEANAVINDKFANNSITATKILNGAISLNKLSNTAVAAISSLRITKIETPTGIGYTDLNTVETITISGSGFQSGLKIFFDETEYTQSNINYVDSNTLTFTAPVLSPDVYHVWIFNPDGGSSVKPLGIRYVSPPIWVTSTLPSANQYSFYSTTMVANSLETLSYSSNSIFPAGLSLSSKGEISGYPLTNFTSYPIEIIVESTSGVKKSRTFSISSIPNSFTANLDVLTVAGGGGGAMGGGGAGGFRIASNLTISSSGNVSVIVGGGGGFSYQNSFNNLNQPGYNSQITGGTGGSSSFSANGLVLLQSSGGSGGGAGFSARAFPVNGGSGGGGGLSAGATFLQLGLVQAAPGGLGNVGGYTPAEGYAGGTAGYNTSLTAANFNSSVYGLPFEKAGGGGGGAGGPGSSVISAAASPTGGAGGPAIYSTFTGANVAYAGGGGGGGGIAGGAGGGAGAGSGAGGGGSNSGSGGDALPNTGSGGGGMKYGYPMNSNDTPTGTITVRSGTGGSGIVYAKVYPTFGFFTGGNLINQTGGVSVYEFKTSNVFVISDAIVEGTTVTWITATLKPSSIESRYYQKLEAQSEVKVYYQIESGNLPQGLTLNGETGVISGVPNSTTLNTIFNFIIKAVNVFGVSSLRTFSLEVIPIIVNYLVVAGGGSGGQNGFINTSGVAGGGGGAGGFLEGNANVILGTYSITIGAGGSLYTNGANSTVTGTNVSLLSVGGGAGGRAVDTQAGYSGTNGGFSGGSGGGGASNNNLVNSAGGFGIPGQGNNGGGGYYFGHGGGGGAGSAGGGAPSLYSGGVGGQGKTWFNGSTYSRGGSGYGVAAANTGNGGDPSSIGGSGIVILRYEGNPVGLGGNVTQSGGYTYHSFTTSGNLTILGVNPFWSAPESGQLGDTLVNGSVVNVTMVAFGSNTPITYSILSGTLPPGISLNSQTGVISGTVSTTISQEYHFTVRATDDTGTFVDRSFVMITNGYYIEFLAIGGGGGVGGGDGQNTGGNGGAAAATIGKFFVKYGTSYTIVVGTGAADSGRGFIGAPGLPGGGSGGGVTGGFDGGAGSGGGWSGITQGNDVYTIAGGGGGAWSRNWATRVVNGSGGGPATGFGATVCSSFNGVNGPSMSGGGGGGFCGGPTGVGGGSYVNTSFVTNGQAFTSSNSAWAPPAVSFTGYDNSLNKGRAGYWYVWNATLTSESGIVVVRYPGVQRGLGGTITTVSGFTVHTFTSNTQVFSA